MSSQNTPPRSDSTDDSTAYFLSDVEAITATEFFSLIDVLGVETVVDIRPRTPALSDGSILSDVMPVAGYGYLVRSPPVEGDRAIEKLARPAPVLILADASHRPDVERALSHIRRLEVHADGSLHTISERLGIE